MNDTTMEARQAEARRRVEAGYEWLVTEGQHWGADVNRIDLDGLDVSSVYMCVLSQATDREYLAVRSEIKPSSDGGVEWALERGFTTRYHTGGDVVTTDDLNEAWVALLTEKRAEA